MNILEYIPVVKDFPKSGINFYDITPILLEPKAFHYVVDKMIDFIKEYNPTAIVAPEARGFLFASAIAYQLNLKFVLARKPNKLPRPTNESSFKLEYGTETLQMHKGALSPKDRVVIIDDILATGGTVLTLIDLVKKEEASVAGLVFLGDLDELHKKDVFGKIPYKKIIDLK